MCNHFESRDDGYVDVVEVRHAFFRVTDIDAHVFVWAIIRWFVNQLTEVFSAVCISLVLYTLKSSRLVDCIYLGATASETPLEKLDANCSKDHKSECEENEDVKHLW